MTHNLFVTGLADRSFNLTIGEDISAGALKQWLSQTQGTDVSFHLTIGGEPLGDSDIIPCGKDWGTTIIRAHPLLRGGKGGFGALIRAVGNRINRSNNKEACRDLSGRRLRDINAQKKVTKWLEEEPERKKRLQEEKKKRLQQRRGQPKHYFDDQAYMKQLRANEEEMDDALKQGLVASSSKGLKRKQPEATAGPSSLKKARLWVGMGEEDLDSEEGDSSEEDEESREQEDEEEEEEEERVPSTEDQLNKESLNSVGSSDDSSKSKGSEEEEEGGRVAECTPGTSGFQQAAGGGGGGSTVVTVDMEKSIEEQPSQAQQDLGSDVQDTRQILSEQPAKEGTVEEKTSDNAEKNDVEPVSMTASEGPQPNNDPLNLDEYSSAHELEAVGPDRLKQVLQSMGLKCGGTVKERAERLFSTKGKTLSELDPSLFAKAGKQRKRKNK